ncbi:MAG: hypothetical protein HQL10_01675 [Nitrospirae bacterium]|nr:hypothetical protein [Nitrospirota bacterium]
MKDDLYVDVVAQTIISKLADELVSNIEAPLNELIKGLLLNDLSNLISTKNKKETELLTKKISDAEEASKSLINSTSSDLKRHIEEWLEKQITTETELKTFIQGEINSLRQTLQTGDKSDSLKGIIESQLTGFTSKTKSLVENIREAVISTMDNSSNEIRDLLSAKIKLETDALTKAIAETKDSSKLLISTSSVDIKKHIDEKIERQIRTEAELKTFIRDELNILKQTLQSEERHDSFKGGTDTQLASFTSKTKTLIDKALLQIESSSNELKRYIEDSFEKQKRINFEHNEQIKEELSAMRQLAIDVLYSQVRQLESEAETQSGKKIELERKIKDLQELLTRVSAAGETE